MYPYIQIGFSGIRAWSIFTFYISFIACGALLLLNRPSDFPLNRIKIFIGFLTYFIMALIGAKMLHLILYAGKYKGMSAYGVLAGSGFAYPGALALGLFGLWVYCRELKVPYLIILDYAAPYIILERVIGRFGCLMAGCCRGIPSNLPWAQNFGDGILRHPTQVYEMTIALGIFVATIATYKKLRQYQGLIFFMVISLYGLMRFFNEFLRIDSPVIIWPFHLAHFAMLFLFSVGVVGLYFVFKRTPQKNELKIGIIQILKIFVISFALSLSVGILILSILG